MPCNSDYMEPTRVEEKLQRSAQLLIYIRAKLGLRAKNWMTLAAETVYCSEDKSVPKLCATLRWLEQNKNNRFLLEHTKDSRDLANWWEEHQAADEKRAQRESQGK